MRRHSLLNRDNLSTRLLSISSLRNSRRKSRIRLIGILTPHLLSSLLIRMLIEPLLLRSISCFLR